MKNSIITTIAALALLVPAAVQAQRVQPVPDEVKEIRIEGHQNLRVVSGDENRIETTDDKNGIARVSNGRLTISSGAGDVTLRLAPWRSMTFRAEEYATIEFNGTFENRENLTIETEDYAQVTFAGDTTDTVRAINLVLRADGFSRITSKAIMQQYNYTLAPSDYARIVLAGMDQMHPSENEGNSWGNRSQSISIDGHGKFYRGRCTNGSTVYATEYPEDDDIAARITVDATDRAVDFARDIAKSTKTIKGKSSHWSSGDFFMRFAWGWHNWGNTPLSGFGGVQGPAELTTSMNNVQLEFNFSLVECRWFSIDAGLGLEWNKFKFADSEVLWDATAMPRAFTLGADPNCSTRLKTRYVTLPLTVMLGDRDDWHLELTALPGLGWTGDNTGLRRQYGSGSGSNNEKDYTINRSLAPYKLDVRASVMYKTIGVYFQLATISAFGDYCQELFPVKFGIIL